MASPQTEMLESFISVGVNTRYKEEPPTEEEFSALAKEIRESTKAMCPVTDFEFDEMLIRLQSKIVIKMDCGVFIYDRNTPHKSWLPARRAELDSFFWRRYKKYLEEIKHWNPRVTATLDKVSDEIVDLLGDPKSPNTFQRRGLVLGDVQSGKTANYTAICNKAADTGYRVIIVLAGIMENLRKQTQERLDAEFSGRKSEYYLDPKAEDNIKNTPVGVGRYGTQKRIASFTSVTKDFDIGVLKSNDLALQNVNDTVVLVVKKNKRILTNLTKWLSKNNTDSTTGKIMLPMLLIDDEADNASVNTKNDDETPAAINMCIRKLLNSFNQASYLGITATPFANIFIDPETEDEMVGDDLFPRDFIYALSPPTHYIGAERIFGDDEEFGNSLIPLLSDEMDHFFPFTHKKDIPVDDLPPSMYEAMAYFLLVNAIRDIRGDNSEHRSMMIHVSRFTDIQNEIAGLINEWLVQIKSDILNYAHLQQEQAEKIKNIHYLKKVWDKYGLSDRAKLEWRIMLSQWLYKAVAPIDVRAVNQSTGATSLDYFNHRDDGLRVIAVGGNSLSRGLTLEGLAVSYFYRKSQMYDTLLQMGRWFGYRPNYEDLFKIWMAKEAIDWYGYITDAAEELKLEISKMRAANQTPLEFGLKVRQDPNSLIATARNKMRAAKPVSRPITVSGKLLETPRLKADKRILDSNMNVIKAFISRLDDMGVYREDVASHFWSGIPKEEVSQLLLDFETHPWHLAFQGRALSEYIEEKMNGEPWDVALVTDGQGTQYPEEIKCGNRILEIASTERRRVIADSKMIRISGTKVKVGAGGCTRIGLTKEQVDAARIEFLVNNPTKTSVPDSAYLIKSRNPLLMLHLIERDLDLKESSYTDVPQFLCAIGVGFPDTGATMKTANYMVNVVELRNWMDPDEDEDE